MFEATRPVYNAMAADEVLGPIVDEITEAGGGIKPEKPLADCGDATDAEALAALNGDYTFTVTAAAGRKAGVTDPEVLDNGQRQVHRPPEGRHVDARPDLHGRTEQGDE